MTSDQFTADVDDLEARLRDSLDRHPAGKGLSKPLTHDDVRAIVSDEIGRAGDLIREATFDGDDQKTSPHRPTVANQVEYVRDFDSRLGVGVDSVDDRHLVTVRIMNRTVALTTDLALDVAKQIKRTALAVDDGWARLDEHSRPLAGLGEFPNEEDGDIRSEGETKHAGIAVDFDESVGGKNTSRDFVDKLLRPACAGQGEALTGVVQGHGHNSSPTVNGTGTATVGDGQVAGIGNTVPAAGGGILFSCDCGFAIAGAWDDDVPMEIDDHREYHRAQDEASTESAHATDVTPEVVGVTLESLAEAVRDALVDETATYRIRDAAKLGLDEAEVNLSYAKSAVLHAEHALREFIAGESKVVS